jgi:hypothetical protein
MNIIEIYCTYPFGTQTPGGKTHPAYAHYIPFVRLKSRFIQRRVYKCIASR